MEPSRVRKVELETEREPETRPEFKVAINDNEGGDQLFRGPAANDNSAVRKVSRDVEPTTRPRDATIRAQRDTLRPLLKPVNDNALQYPTVDQTFRNTYVDQAVGPSILAQSQQKYQTRPPIQGGDPTIRISSESMLAGSPYQRSLGRRTEVSGRREYRVGRAAALREKLATARKAKETVKDVKTTVRAAEISFGMASTWGLAVYLFQLTFAVIAIVALLVSSGFKALNDTLVGYVLPNAFDPEPLFYMGIIVALAAGYVTLFAAGFVYMSAQVPCLWGDRAGGKWLALLVAFIGYSLPILNLFPWALVWFFVVSTASINPIKEAGD